MTIHDPPAFYPPFSILPLNLTLHAHSNKKWVNAKWENGSLQGQTQMDRGRIKVINYWPIFGSFFVVTTYVFEGPRLLLEYCDTNMNDYMHPLYILFNLPITHFLSFHTTQIGMPSSLSSSVSPGLLGHNFFSFYTYFALPILFLRFHPFKFCTCTFHPCNQLIP